MTTTLRLVLPRPGRPTAQGDAQLQELGVCGGPWRAVDGDVRVPAAEAEWWGASLAVLVAAVHHPGVLAARMPDTDPTAVATEVLASVDELQRVGECAGSQGGREDAKERPTSASVRGEGDEVVFSPGAEVANLAFCLVVFATALVEPEGPEAAIARGATAYAAAAWSTDIGKASGSL